MYALQTDTYEEVLKEDCVTLPIRFISDKDYITTNRYSILVKQYVENLEAYTFHKTIKEIASSSSILSPKQPGLVNGNLKCISNADEKVIVFFDVAATSSNIKPSFWID
ncbi:DUF4249 domain-containing protein [Flavobacterium sp. LS1R49]|uniref:DUF4249 domain-containing protein n=1 Tax=Flavobacterium shii TaxID=2987687 RepID=A0A9X3C442_9FLAO|nr:DUF4249 domain-containing protein [Flavobacterium shii]MCV9926684.1 DUF4249 domain-containing protein [Flavobacterium shii]